MATIEQMLSAIDLINRNIESHNKERNEHDSKIAQFKRAKLDLDKRIKVKSKELLVKGK